MIQLILDLLWEPATFLWALIICGVIVLIMRKRRGCRDRVAKSNLTPADDVTLEKIWKGLQRMEDRVGNLETILLQRERVKASVERAGSERD